MHYYALLCTTSYTKDHMCDLVHPVGPRRLAGKSEPGRAGGRQKPARAARVQGLQPGTAYYVHVIAENRYLRLSLSSSFSSSSSPRSTLFALYL